MPPTALSKNYAHPTNAVHLQLPTQPCSIDHELSTSVDSTTKLDTQFFAVKKETHNAKRTVVSVPWYIHTTTPLGVMCSCCVGENLGV